MTGYFVPVILRGYECHSVDFVNASWRSTRTSAVRQGKPEFREWYVTSGLNDIVIWHTQEVLPGNEVITMRGEFSDYNTKKNKHQDGIASFPQSIT